MRSSTPGKRTSKPEVLGISRHGLWLLVGGKEYLLTFADHPWFADATVRELCHVRLCHRTHLHWPDLDVDLELDSLDRSEHYPLIAKRIIRPAA